MEREHLGNHVIFIGSFPHFWGMFTRWRSYCEMWVQIFLGTSWEHLLFLILTYYCCLFPVPTSPPPWWLGEIWYFWSCWELPHGTIISWGTVPRSHANPTLPLFSACAPRRRRRGLSRTPATKTESSFVLLFEGFRALPGFVFFFFFFPPWFF
jgi:hypothetical protein